VDYLGDSVTEAFVIQRLTRRLAALLPALLFRAALVEGQTLVLRGATLIDGTDRTPRSAATVVVKNGWIVAVGRAEEVRAPVGARTVDLGGRYLVPGFVEMHGHLAIGVWEPDPIGGKPALRYAYDEVATRELTRSQLAFGITTVRNPAAPTVEGVTLRNRVRRGEQVGPRIITAGAPLDRLMVSNGVETVTTETEVRAAVAKEAALGVDFIKLYHTLDSAQIRAGVDEAHKHGLRAVAHLWLTSWTDAATAGLDGITHIIVNNAGLLPEANRAEYQRGIRGGQFMFDWFKYADFDGPEIRGMIAALVAHRITIDPTLVAFEATAWATDSTHYPPESNRYVPPTYLAKMKDGGAALRGWPAEDYLSAQRQFRRMQELARRLHESGVPLTVGTDGANPWLFHHELELLVGAGIPPAAVIQMATRNGAVALGLISEIGTVEVGKRADLVVLDADPIADIRNTRRIAWVIQDGRLAKPEVYLPDRLKRRNR
jgi:imidazolonepropionase-like amidohydrolase